MKTGDIVMLKSGSPLMTLIERTGSKWDCIWFQTQKLSFNRKGPEEFYLGNYLTGSFPEEALKTLD